MRLRLSFKGSRKDYVSRLRQGVGWTCVAISRGQKLTTTDAPSAFLFGMRSGTHLWELCAPGDSKRKRREQTSWA